MSASEAPPRVSVLMPVFNTARYLKDALHSIRAQSLTAFELIAVDDGSTDDSRAVLREFAAQDSRVRLVLRENRGLIATRNELLRAARAELVAWMDSDDISLPERLRLQVAAFEADPELICLGTAAQCIDPEGRFLNVERYPCSHEQILHWQQHGGAIRFPTTMMRRARALQVGGFREPFRMGEDFDLLLRLSEIGKMANLADTLYLYRQHLRSVCATIGPQWPVYRDHALALARERRERGSDRLQDGGTLVIPMTDAAYAKRNEWLIYRAWAGHALGNEDFGLARRYAWAALRRRPASPQTWKLALRVVLRRARAAGRRGAASAAARQNTPE